MTVKISPSKVSRILRYFFRGKTQTEIAQKVKVNQGTVSLYGALFNDTSKQRGLGAAGKEFGVYEEVVALRSLAVELDDARLTTEDAWQGVKIINKFSKLGVDSAKHLDLVQLCKKIDNPEFIHSALRFIEIEDGSGLSYGETIRRFEETAQKLPAAEARLLKMQGMIKTLDASLTDKKQELSDLDSQLVESRKQAELEKTALKGEIEEERKQKQASLIEIKEVRNLKNMLNQEGLDIDTLVKLAQEFGK